LLLELLLLNRLERGPGAVRKTAVLSRPLAGGSGGGGGGGGGGGVGFERWKLFRSVISDAVVRRAFANVVPKGFRHVPVGRHGGRRGGRRTATADPPLERRLYPTKTVAPVAL